MDAQPTILDLLFSGADPVEVATLVETDQVIFSDDLGRPVTPSMRAKAKIIEQIVHHTDMVHERKKPWQFQDDEAYSYWAYGLDTPNRDYGGERPPEIDRAWLKSPKPIKTKEQQTTGKSSEAGADLGNFRWEPERELKLLIKEAAKPMILRGQLKHNEIARLLYQSGRYDLSEAVIRAVVKDQCRALGRTDLIRGSKARK